MVERRSTRLGELMDVEGLVDQLYLGEQLPGVAVLVARDVIESAVIVGSLGETPARWLNVAAEHLRQAREHCPELASCPSLPDQLLDIANAGELPPVDRLGHIRNTLRYLVRAMPAEGSVPSDVEYAGF